MRSFDEILAIVAERKGGVDDILAASPTPKSPEEMAVTVDRDWLATMASWIFRAGISWKVVSNKWEGIEAAFQGFDIGKMSMLDDDGVDALLSDPRVIRSGAKIISIRDNAAFIRRVAAEHGSFGRRIADWPDSDFAGLLAWFGKEGSRLGGGTGPHILRDMGKDTYVLTDDVILRLQVEGVISGKPGSAKSMAAVQAAFNQWREESGLTFNQISRILARSIDA